MNQSSFSRCGSPWVQSKQRTAGQAPLVAALAFPQETVDGVRRVPCTALLLILSYVTADS